jgi:hypothetical protein
MQQDRFRNLKVWQTCRVCLSRNYRGPIFIEKMRGRMSSCIVSSSLRMRACFGLFDLYRASHQLCRNLSARISTAVIPKRRNSVTRIEWKAHAGYCACFSKGQMPPRLVLRRGPTPPRLVHAVTGVIGGGFAFNTQESFNRP